MSRERITYLLERYLDRKLTEAELHELTAMLLDRRAVKSVRHSLEQVIEQSPDAERFEGDHWEQLCERILSGEQAKVVEMEGATFVRRFSFARIAAAAAIFIALSAGIYTWVNHRSSKQIAQTEQQKALQHDIAPGGNKATLTLADGRIVPLDSLKNGLVAEQGKVSVIKANDGTLSYRADDGAEEQIHYNTISIPKGGQFKVILPDGTEVWLNAASSLTYPTVFTGNERRVSLTGEGYFEVTHNAKQPFIVDAANIEVHDLGTEFNINAYGDEPFIQATLVEGLAEVSNGTAVSKLQPGQAAYLSGQQINVLPADTEMAAAWKNDLFVFNGTDIGTIMRQVSRWYNVDIAFEQPVSKRFYGTISRKEPMTKVFQLLEMTHDVHFKIEERKVIVTP